jgi:hypothetical protein
MEEYRWAAHVVVTEFAGAAWRTRELESGSRRLTLGAHNPPSAERATGLRAVLYAAVLQEKDRVLAACQHLPMALGAAARIGASFGSLILSSPRVDHVRPSRTIFCSRA